MFSPIGKEKGGKGCEMDVLTHKSVCPAGTSLEFSMELEKWQSAFKAHQLLLPHQNPESEQPILS